VSNSPPEMDMKSYEQGPYPRPLAGLITVSPTFSWLNHAPTASDESMKIFPCLSPPPTKASTDQKNKTASR